VRMNTSGHFSFGRATAFLTVSLANPEFLSNLPISIEQACCILTVDYQEICIAALCAHCSDFPLYIRNEHVRDWADILYNKQIGRCREETHQLIAIFTTIRNHHFLFSNTGSF
jgi:hypothetical protein